ncbi:substrate-binding domain-containing protein [Ferviditalea candida]|uniref:Substrate-binding domain-containing protein n=1 Tax=Ferviditalea candida TaxID=3108399 RepID=A0ABU5ZGN4_9BACL|nr:substrate-binding domain-containing protein [Paenibacillaceae bacterium T2]
MKKWGLILSLLLVIGLTACGKSGQQAQPSAQLSPAHQTPAQTPAQTPDQTPGSAKENTSVSAEDIVLATTTSTQDSGLLDVLIPALETSLDHKVKIKVVAVGTGQAIQLGQDGNADVLLVHARKSEDEFMNKGYGTYAWDVMYNQFLLVGPKDDPAKVKSAFSAADAFERIAKAKAVFLSRGDNSGTHKKELSIWEMTNVKKPSGDWYKSVGQAMGATLQMAGQLNAYTLVDEATYLTHKEGLEMVYSGDKAMFNPYGIMIVKSTKKPGTAKQVVDFIVGSEGQKIIGDFGKDKYGKSIFVPNAKQR